MKIETVRYAYITTDMAPQHPIMEKMVFIEAGTEGVSVTDQRLVAVPDGVGGYTDALFTSVTNPLYVVPMFPRAMHPTKRINPFTYLVEMIDVPGDPPMTIDYYNSPFWDPMAIPVEAKYTVIDEDTYWDMMSTYHLAHAPSLP